MEAKLLCFFGMMEKWYYTALPISTASFGSIPSNVFDIWDPRPCPDLLELLSRLLAEDGAMNGWWVHNPSQAQNLAWIKPPSKEAIPYQNSASKYVQHASRRGHCRARPETKPTAFLLRSVRISIGRHGEFRSGEGLGCVLDFVIKRHSLPSPRVYFIQSLATLRIGARNK